MNDQPSPGLVLVLIVLALIFAGGAWAWFSYQESKTGFEENSICQKELENRRDWWTTAFLGSVGKYDPKDPQAVPRRLGEALYKIENANRDRFVAILDKVDFVRRTGIGRGAICLPDPTTRNRLWPLEEFNVYDASLKARLNTDVGLCRKTFEADVIEYLEARFPCARTP